MGTFCRDKTVYKIKKKSALDKSCELKIILMFVKKKSTLLYMLYSILLIHAFVKCWHVPVPSLKKKLLHFSFTFSYYIIFKCL